MTGNVSSGNLTNYYLFLTQFSNVAQQMDTNGDNIVTKNEFQNFFVQNWNGTSSTAEGALEMDLVNRLFQEFNTVGGYGKVNNHSNFNNGTVLYGSEINGMNETIQQYAVLNSYRDRLNAIPGISDFPQVISLALAQLGALVVQNVNNPDSETPIETILENNFANIVNECIQAVVPNACLATIADRPELNGLNYNYQDDSTLNSIVTNFVNSVVQSGSGEVISITDIQQGIADIINAYLSTALLGEGVDDISILTDNGYNNNVLNDLQKSVLEKTIKDRIISLAGSDYQNHKALYDNAIVSLFNQLINPSNRMARTVFNFENMLALANAVEIPQSVKDTIYKENLIAELMDLRDNITNEKSLDNLLLKALEGSGYDIQTIAKIFDGLMKGGHNNKILAALEDEFSNGSINMRNNDAIIAFYVSYIQEHFDEITKVDFGRTNPNSEDPTSRQNGQGNNSGTQATRVPGNGNNGGSSTDIQDYFLGIEGEVDYKIPGNGNNSINGTDIQDYFLGLGGEVDYKQPPSNDDIGFIFNPIRFNGESPSGATEKDTSDVITNLQNEIIEIYEAQIARGGAYKDAAVKAVGGETKYVEYVKAMDEKELQKTLVNIREKIEVVEQREQRIADNRALNETLEKMKAEEQESQNARRLNIEM